MGFSLLSLSRVTCLLSCASLLPIGVTWAQSKPTPPTKPVLSPATRPPTPDASKPVLGEHGSIECATRLFQSACTFRFRWTEQRDPRRPDGNEYRRLTCEGEAQRFGDSLRLRFKVTMVTDVDTQHSEWIVLGGIEGGNRYHRGGPNGVWTEITNATPWLTELTNSLRLSFLWRTNSLYPTYLPPTRPDWGRWNTYHFVYGNQDAYYIQIDKTSGKIIQVTHRSTSDALPYTFKRTIDYWGYDLFTEITSPKPDDTGPLPIPATSPITDHRLLAP